MILMAISSKYRDRGDIKSKEAKATMQWLKNKEKCTFGLNERPSAISTR